MIPRRAIALLLLSVAGCTGEQAAFNPAGAQAQRISSLWWMYCWICVAVYIISMAVILAGAAIRRRREKAIEPEKVNKLLDPRRERRYGIVVAGSLAITTVILFIFMFSEFVTARDIASLAGDTSAITIKVTGHQWWWELEYQDADIHNNFTTANEMHIPV